MITLTNNDQRGSIVAASGTDVIRFEMNSLILGLLAGNNIRIALEDQKEEGD